MEPLQNAAPFSIETRLHLLVTGGFLLEGDYQREAFYISKTERLFAENKLTRSSMQTVEKCANRRVVS